MHAQQEGASQKGAPFSTKCCTGCKEEKHLLDFYSDKSKEDGRSTRCKTCINIRQSSAEVRQRASASRRAKYATNPEKFLSRNKVWRGENAEKVSKITLAWARKNPEKRKEISKRYEVNNPETVKESRRKTRIKNRDSIKAYQKEYALRKPEIVRARVDRWQKKNPEKLLANCAKRRAKKLQATPSWANEFFIAETYKLAKLREKVCGGKWHVDHIVPLRSKLVCGLHTEQNLQVIPQSVNQRKSNCYWPDMP